MANMVNCRLIYPYYENPKMLERQVENWNRYSGDLRDHVKIILVDDGSPTNPARPIVETCKAPIALYRVLQNIPWGQHGARNIGAKVCGKDGTWMFMSDMDILLTPEMAYTLLTKDLDPAHTHTFERHYLTPGKEPKYHCNSFMVLRDHYWKVGGYDEDYCGTYGGDGPFLRQLNVVAPREHHDDIILLGVDTDVCADANTQAWDRTGPFKEEYRRRFDEKRRKGDERSLNPLRTPWERLI